MEMGRPFDPTEKLPVTVISHGFWQQHFGGRPDVVGRSVRLGSTAFSIVGVAHVDFEGTQPDLRWDLLAPFEAVNTARGLSPQAIRNDPIGTVVRLKPGVSAQEYESRVGATWPDILRATVPADTTLDAWTTRMGSQLVTQPLDKGLSFTLTTNPGLPRAVMLAVGLSGLIFLASCLTLVLLVVARGLRQQRHTAVKLALGGSRWRVARPDVIECGMTSILGCSGGLLIAYWGNHASRAYVPGSWQIGLAPAVITVALAMAAATTMLDGIVLVYLSSRGSLREILQFGSRTAQSYVRFVRRQMI